MKEEVREILGRTITGVMISEAAFGEPPQSQVILFFADGTSYEFYSDGYIATTAGVRERDPERLQHSEGNRLKVRFEAFIGPAEAEMES